MTDFFRLIFLAYFLAYFFLIFMFYRDLRERSVKSQDKTSSTTSEKSYITFQSLRNYPSETVALKSALLKTFVWKNCPSKNVQMRINENTDVNAFYLFPTRYGLKLASNIYYVNNISKWILCCQSQSILFLNFKLYWTRVLGFRTWACK